MGGLRSVPRMDGLITSYSVKGRFLVQHLEKNESSSGRLSISGDEGCFPSIVAHDILV